MIKRGTLMKKEQQIDIKFEKYNSKYNRIWEQLTNIAIFVLTTISGYLIAISAIRKDINTILTLEQVNYILLSIGILLGISCGILISHLVSARKEIIKIVQENKIY